MRKLLAVWAAKLAGVAGRLIGKKSSSSPGVLALKICPDLIQQLRKNIRKGIIVTCGTNGKTTTNNLLNTVLQKRGYTTVCNRLGANMLGGIATAFTDACNLFGTFSADYAVLEIDEASAGVCPSYAKLYDYYQPLSGSVRPLRRNRHHHGSSA